MARVGCVATPVIPLNVRHLSLWYARATLFSVSSLDPNGILYAKRGVLHKTRKTFKFTVIKPILFLLRVNHNIYFPIHTTSNKNLTISFL